MFDVLFLPCFQVALYQTGMENRFVCPYCDVTADDMYTWKKHMSPHVGLGSQEFQVYRCLKCKWTSTEKQRVSLLILRLSFSKKCSHFFLGRYYSRYQKIVSADGCLIFEVSSAPCPPLLFTMPMKEKKC